MSYLPGTLRSCDAPRCPATYDATTGPLEQAQERRWRLHRTFGLHLCPDHSGLWGAGDGPHAPHLDHPTKAASCSCGQALPDGTLGEMRKAYLRHIGDIEARGQGGPPTPAATQSDSVGSPAELP